MMSKKTREGYVMSYFYEPPPPTRGPGQGEDTASVKTARINACRALLAAVEAEVIQDCRSPGVSVRVERSLAHVAEVFGIVVRRAETWALPDGKESP